MSQEYNPTDTQFADETNEKDAEKMRRFFSFVRLNGARCWEWTGNTDKDGYAKFCVDGVNVRAARWSYETFRGPIHPDLQIDHLCRNHPCVNPHHLEPVTPRVNMIRGISPAAKNARKTHCANGHEFTELTTYFYPKGRYCKICIVERAREYRARNRDEINRREKDRREARRAKAASAKSVESLRE